MQRRPLRQAIINLKKLPELRERYAKPEKPEATVIVTKYLFINNSNLCYQLESWQHPKCFYMAIK